MRTKIFIKFANINEKYKRKKIFFKNIKGKKYLN